MRPKLKPRNKIKKSLRNFNVRVSKYFYNESIDFYSSFHESLCRRYYNIVKI